MENDNTKKLEMLEAKIDAVYSSVEKIRKYLFWTMVVTLVVVVLPLIGLVFAIPAFLNNYVGALNGVV